MPANTMVESREGAGAHRRWRWQRDIDAGRVEAVLGRDRVVLSSYSAVADRVIAFRSSGSSSTAPVEPSLLYPPFSLLPLLLLVVTGSGGHQGGGEVLGNG